MLITPFNSSNAANLPEALAEPPRPTQQVLVIKPPEPVAETKIQPPLTEVKTFNKDDPTTYPQCNNEEWVSAETGLCIPKQSEAPQMAQTAYSARAGSAGNLYDWGNCTWYVKNKRPDLPNNLGDAGNWTYNARIDGLATGSTPRAGAAGVTYGHVVYVESVNGDGTINISEMNVFGLGVTNSRLALSTDFTYIY